MALTSNQQSLIGHDAQLKILTLSLILFFTLNPIFDFVTTFLTSSTESSNRISLVSRGLCTLIISIFSLSIALKKQRTFILLLLPVVVTIASVFTWSFIGMYEEKVALETVNVAFKAFGFFFFCIAFKQLFKNGRDPELIERIVKISFITYTTSIILGAALGIDSFRSYGEVRFGYKGIILAQNEASALLLIGLLFFGYKLVLGISDKIDLIGMITAVASAFIIGTKAAFILPLATLTVILIAKNGIIKSSPFIIASLIALPTAIYGLTLVNSSINDVVEGSMQYLSYQLSNYANGSILSLLLSGRDDKLIYALYNIIDNNPLYLLFGGYPLGLYSTELDLFDLAFMFGIPLFIIYIINLKNEFTANKNGITLRYYTLAFILVIITSNSAGHVLTSALALPYMAFFCVYGSIHTQNTRMKPR